jgi:hypothetical protein
MEPEEVALPAGVCYGAALLALPTLHSTVGDKLARDDNVSATILLGNASRSTSFARSCCLRTA